MKSLFAKTLSLLCVIVLFMYVYTNVFFSVNSVGIAEEFIAKKHRGFEYIYILQWTPGSRSPFDFMGKGQSAFIANNCTYQNCYVTDDRTLLSDYKLFDAVVFNGHSVTHSRPKDLPQARSFRQKYIFGAMESAHNYPVCTPSLDGFFNWTWTYRLDSDVRWGYVTFYHLNGSVAGPKADMVWPKNLEPIGDDIKNRLESKSKAVAWFVSNCVSRSSREKFVNVFEKELNKRGLILDIYGKCGSKKCNRNKSKMCLDILEKDYYFYLSFENSFAVDYVTEKLLTALNYLTVPIVFGAANYSRFLPDGSYLNALELGPVQLANKVASIISDKSQYYKFFSWRNHYRYTETSSTQDICNLCALLNDATKYTSYSVYENFRMWWYPRYERYCNVF